MHSVPSTPAAKPFDYYSLDSRGWSIDYVREGLGINQKRYSHIAAEVEKRMRMLAWGEAGRREGPIRELHLTRQYMLSLIASKQNFGRSLRLGSMNVSR